MKKSTLIKLAAMLGLCAGSVAHAQVFNMHDIAQGYANNGYNYMYYGQGAASTGNNIWNGFDNGGGPGSTDSFGGGNNYTDPLTSTPGNPYANSRGAYWAPNNGQPTGPVVLFSPGNAGNKNAGDSWSDGTLSPITVPVLVRGFDSGAALNVSQRTTPSWIFSLAAVVNTASPAWGQNVAPYSPLGLCVLSNVPPGIYSLYLYGANYDGTRGASFVVSNTGTPLNGLYQTMNPNAAAGAGPLNSFGLGTNYVVYDDVTPDAMGRIVITWGPVSNINSGLTGEGDFNGLQLVTSSANPAAPPAIVQQPYNSIFNEGATATLFADGRGNPAPTFTWYEIVGSDTNPIPDQISNTLTFANFQSSEAGSYFCVASNSGGAVTSLVASLSFDSTNAIDIVAQTPTNGATIVAGENLALTLSVSAFGALPITYYWESNGVVIDTINNGTAYSETNASGIEFGTSSTITVSNLTSSCALSCVVSNSSGAVTNTPVAVTEVQQLTGAYDVAVLDLNPIAYWPLNETNGTVAVNYSLTYGIPLNGTYENNIPSAPNDEGLPGPDVFGFSGNNFAVGLGTANGQNYVATENSTKGISGTGILINNPVLDVSGDETITAWVQIPANQPINNNIQYLYGQSGDDTLIDWGQSGDGNNQMWISVGGGPSSQGGPALNDGQWHLWTVTYSASSKTATCYLDGLTNFAATFSGEGSSTSPTDIGSSTADTRNFDGNVCRLAVFTNTLTAAQVYNLYNLSGFATSITLNPASTSAEAGESVQFGPVAAIGSTPIAFYWYRGTPGNATLLSDGNRISGATSTNLIINPVAGSDQNSYFVVASNAFTTSTSSVVTLTVATTNTARIYAGGTPTFSVTAGNGQYQWMTNGTAVTGATSNTFTLANPQNNETVVCEITGSFTGAVSSSTNYLTIVPAPTDLYATTVLSNHPIAYFRFDEANVYGDNSAGDDGLPAYDYISGHNGVYSNVILNTTTTGTPYGDQQLDADGDVTFGEEGFGTPSMAAFIPVIDFGLGVSNSPAQPGNAEFSVEAWVQGLTGDNHGIVTKGYGGGNQALPNGEQFSLQTTVGGGNFAFVVDDALGNKVFVYTPNDLNWHHLVGVCDEAHGQVLLYKDGLLAMSAAITPGNGLLASPVPLSIGAKQQTDTSGNYNGQFLGDVDELAIYNYALTSNQVAADFYAAGIAPIIVSSSPATVAADEGSATNLTVVARGTLPLSYQWTGPGGVISDATNATLTLDDLNASGTPPNTGPGEYTCTITNLYGTNTVMISLVVNSGPPNIVQSLPAYTIALAGGTAIFPVVVQGTEPFTNVWQSNGVTLVNGGRVSGATSTTLTISNVEASDAGTYQYFVSSAEGNNSGSPVSTVLIVENEPLLNTNGSGWTANGNASIANNLLTLTTKTGGGVSSFFFNTPMYIGAFEASWTYQDVGAGGADGCTFCIQNSAAGTAALGGGGSSLGYNPNITDSAALAWELYNNGDNAPGIYFATNGQPSAGAVAGGYDYISTSPVRLTSGDPIDFTMTYNGSVVTLSLLDETSANTYSTTFNVGSLPAIVGGNTAYVGFTGASGGVTALQTITNFVFTPIPVLSAVSSAGSVVITWPTAIGGYVLQQSSSLSLPNWTTVAGPYNTVNGQYQVVVSPSGNEFYRLVVSN